MSVKAGARGAARCFLAGAVVLAAPACWAGGSGTWSVGTGFNYNSGKYGETMATEVTAIPFSAGYDQGPWSLKLSVPYLKITGPGDVIVVASGRGKRRSERTTTITRTTVVRTVSGLGDLVAGATYNFYHDTATKFGADVTGRVKFGTADSDKGLGTGKNDYVVQLDLYKGYKQWTTFGGIGYADLGSSADIPLKNVFNATAGASYTIDTRRSAGLAYDFREKSSRAGAAQSELAAYFVHRFNGGVRAQAYLLKGFSTGSPDWGGGASVGYVF